MKKMMRSSYSITALFFLILLRPVHADLVLGVHPYLDAATIIERFQPLAEYLAMQLDTDVEVRVGRNYASLMQAVGQDKIDIAKHRGLRSLAQIIGLTTVVDADYDSLRDLMSLI